MLHEEVELFNRITGEDGWTTSMMRVGGVLDGYHKGIEDAIGVVAKYLRDNSAEVTEELSKLLKA